jgi:N-acetylglucosamine-6-phosphate deacetylase
LAAIQLYQKHKRSRNTANAFAEKIKASSMKINAKNIYSGGKNLGSKTISIENGIIVSIKTLDLSKAEIQYENLAPGLIDLHINGGEAFHFTHSPTTTCIEDIIQSAEKTGTAYLLPTLITSPIETIFEGIGAIKKHRLENPQTGVLGMHLEGPFLNPKKRGAHLEKYIQKPDLGLLKEIVDFGGQDIKLMTVAPEMFTKKELQFLLDSPIKISAGHSNATFDEAQTAFKQGITLVTHLYNAMSAFGHRAPGLIGAALYNEKVYTPLILDGVHSSWEAAAIAYKNKGDKMFLISDALFQNHKKQTFEWGDFNAKITNGQYYNTDGNLAGAAISLADAVENAHQKLNIPLALAIQMATEIPISMIHCPQHIGKIEVGYEARFFHFSDDLKVKELLKY